MAIKANASSQGAQSFKKYVGVASFRVLGVNPTKEELEKFYGREVSNEPKYFTDMTDSKDNGKPYKRLRVSFMIQADDPSHIDANNKETLRTNANLTEPLKTTVNFFIDSRYNYNSDKTKVQVIDKYGRTAWVTVQQAENHQIPVYKNGPAKIDADYRPAYRGEEELTKFILNYLNVTPIDTYNRNTGEWVTNPHPEDCEGMLYEIKEYFKGNIEELKNDCKMMPSNCIKLCVGVQTTDQGNQLTTVYNRVTLRNGSQSYTPIKDSIQGQGEYLNGTVFTNDPAGIISNIEEYKEDVKETSFATPANSSEDLFASNSCNQSDLPFGGSSDYDPFGVGN